MEIDKRVQSMLMPTAGPSAADLVALQAAQGHEDDDFDHEMGDKEEEEEEWDDDEEEEWHHTGFFVYDPEP